MTAVRRLPWSAAALLAMGAAAGGEEIGVELTFVPATPQVNTLRMNVVVDSHSFIGRASDSDTTTVAGTVSALLTAEFNAGTNAAIVGGLEFTGGRYTLSDVAFHLEFGPLGMFGWVDAAGRGLAGTLETNDPPAPVTGQTFAASDHRAVLNSGLIHAEAGGLLAGQVDPVDIDLAREPISAPGVGTGTLRVSLAGVADGNATYDVLLELPVDLTTALADPNTGVTAELTAAGLFRAAGAFTRAVGVFGDFNDDGNVDAADVDILAGRLGTASPPCDLDGSGAVDGADMDRLIHDVLGTEYGDADLDGRIGAADYLALKASLGGAGAVGWAGGDFTADGTVDAEDLAVLTSGFGAGPGPTAALPEPTAAVLLLAAGACGLPRRSRRRCGR